MKKWELLKPMAVWIAIIWMGTTPTKIAAGEALVPLSTKTLHLGTPGKPEWERFSRDTALGQSLELAFPSVANTHEATLLIRQDDVKADWAVEINGRKVGTLFLMEADLWHTLSIPAGVLHDGTNLLRIAARQADDILLKGIYLSPISRTNLLAQARVHVAIREHGKGVPCRITIVDENGALTPIAALPGQHVAVRPGVVYTADGAAELGLLPGKYTVYATRGPEYSLAKKALILRGGADAGIDLSLKREVPTQGWAACDTHIHTLELSRHGDATLDERMLTLAGEGIELPVATEHNQHANYEAAAERTGTRKYFTPIPGNEVTTPKGHFNIFPVDRGAAVPDWKIEDWPALMKNLRRTPGVQVIVLNHPYNIHENFQPFAATNFVVETGENLRGFDFEFDAIELVNSGAMQSDWMRPYRAWFGLLNRGYRIFGVGSSDSHDVSRYIVGQGRTYIQCEDANPAAISISEVCKSLRAGRAGVSLGLFAKIEVNRRYGPGEVVSASGNRIRVRVEVLGPSWISATNLTLYANGTVLKSATISSSKAGKGGTKAVFNWDFPRPQRDTWLVAVATGPGVTGPWWATAKPYQPASTRWDPIVIASTNPVWLDVDGDGKFTPPAGE